MAPCRWWAASRSSSRCSARSSPSSARPCRPSFLARGGHPRGGVGVGRLEGAAPRPPLRRADRRGAGDGLRGGRGAALGRRPAGVAADRAVALLGADDRVRGRGRDQRGQHDRRHGRARGVHVARVAGVVRRGGDAFGTAGAGGARVDSVRRARGVPGAEPAPAVAAAGAGVPGGCGQHAAGVRAGVVRDRPFARGRGGRCRRSPRCGWCCCRWRIRCR